MRNSIHKGKSQLTVHKHLGSRLFFDGDPVAHLFSFIFCFVFFVLFVFVLCLVCPMLLVSLDCSFGFL